MCDRHKTQGKYCNEFQYEVDGKTSSIKKVWGFLSPPFPILNVAFILAIVLWQMWNGVIHILCLGDTERMRKQIVLGSIYTSDNIIYNHKCQHRKLESLS